MKFFTLLLSLLDRMWSAWENHKLRQEGREEVLEEVKDAVEGNVELAEAAITVPDPERDERLRSRFDRSKNGQ